MRGSHRQPASVDLDRGIEEILRNCLVHFSGTLAIMTIFGNPDKHYAVTTYRKSPPIDWEGINGLLNEAQRARPQSFSSMEIPKAQEDLRNALDRLSDESLDLIISAPFMRGGDLIGAINIFGEHTTENLVISNPLELFEGYLSLAAELVSTTRLKKDAGENADAEGIITELPIGLLLTDADGLVVRINDVLADMLDIAEVVDHKNIESSQLLKQLI